MTVTEAWEALGAIVASSPDPLSSIEPVHAYLCDPDGRRRAEVERLGISWRAIDDFRPALPADVDELLDVSRLAAAWALGRVSAHEEGRWRPVVSGEALDPDAFERLTAEAIIGLIVSAERRVRIFSPYVDLEGVRPLTPALSAATMRGVSVSMGFRKDADQTGAIEFLRTSIAEQGVSRLFSAQAFGSRGFAHLKLVLADGHTAYIGSANMTHAGLTRNYELGAIVTGREVQVFESFLDHVGA